MTKEKNQSHNAESGKKSRAGDAAEVREQRLTYDDYAAIDDGLRYELADGRLELMSPGPTSMHQLVSFEMQRTIFESCHMNYIVFYSPIDLILSTYEVRQPDLLMIHRSRMDIIRMRGIEGTPDLVVEILSPSTLRRDKLDKLRTYARYGIPEYWVVEPKVGMLEQYVLQGERYELHNVYEEEEPVSSPTVPCISFTMKGIMDNIPSIRD
ncbi:Uma2 family endonuclease [Paenibacillus sp. J5C_2022]|uniref:Uma2 family endonuclease n=1 Tax=Paenibacillus sp. J5C2022 TaxID=2977129 RepID=UPI0021CEBE85|nr:Uma2 family endonuclease [Paenibacillus sp. J5C2022]MCU6707540.1 Uma2 family endonuclease [Paenibacillus sp. J5C2022]